MMKRLIIFLLLFEIAGFIFLSCKKDPEPINIDFYYKPLATIQKYIQGKWKFIYGKGGFCGYCYHYCDSCYVEFTSDNRFISNTFIITSDTTTVNWVKGTGTNNDSTYIMEFKDSRGLHWGIILDGIYNDTLMYHENASDAIYYHFIKLK